MHRLLLEGSIHVSACLLDPHSRPTKLRIQVTIAYSGNASDFCVFFVIKIYCELIFLMHLIQLPGPGQQHVTALEDKYDEDEVDDDRRALINIERNIANIERSMSASQLEQAHYRMQFSTEHTFSR